MKRYRVVLLVVVVGACERDSEAVPDVATATASAVASAPAELSGDVLIEDREGGSITWKIAGDGAVTALVELASRPTRDASGSLVFRGSEEKSVLLGVDPKSGLLTAAGPKLEADLTEMAYTVKLPDEQWSGVLHLPRGGIPELLSSAKASAKSGVDTTTIGPHGGVVEAVGPDVYEIIAIEDSGELRAYLLDVMYRDVRTIGDRKITVGVEGETGGPKMAALVRDPELGLYASAQMKLEGDPQRITLAVRDGAKVSAALVGFKPGSKLLVSNRLKIHVDAKAVADFDAKAKAKLKK